MNYEKPTWHETCTGISISDLMYWYLANYENMYNMKQIGISFAWHNIKEQEIKKYSESYAIWPNWETSKKHI